MSRRASLLAKQEKRKPKVRFPDELVFLDNIKGNDIQACHSMLRRASVQLDINGLDNSGVTPLHNAVLEGNLAAVKLLVQHGADVNKKDADTWTPLHAACANGEAEIARYLLSKGASKDIKTCDGERSLDLCDARDFSIISVMLESDTARRARLLSAPDEGLEDMEDEDFKNDNDNDNSDDTKNSSKNRGSYPNSADDSSPEPPRRNRSTREDVKNANESGSKSTTGILKGMSNLKPPSSSDRSSRSTLTVKTSAKSGCSPTRQKYLSSGNSSTVQGKPPKPVGHSILKKTPQQFKTGAD